MEVNCTYHGDHSAIYVNIKSLPNIPETNMMLCQLYLKKTNNGGGEGRQL